MINHMETMEEPDVIASKSRSKDEKPPRGYAGHPGTKRAVMVQLLKRQSGATIEDISNATGWKRPAVIGYIQFIRWVTENGITSLEKRTKRDGTLVYRAV